MNPPLNDGKLKVESYRLYPVDDVIKGDRAIAEEIETFKKAVTAAVFATRGYNLDQPLAVAPQDLLSQWDSELCEIAQEYLGRRE